MTRRFTPLTLSQAVEARRRYLRGFSMREIADRLGSKEGRVKTALAAVPDVEIRTGSRLTNAADFEPIPVEAVELVRQRCQDLGVAGQRIHDVVSQVATELDLPRQLLALAALGPGPLTASSTSLEERKAIYEADVAMREATRELIKLWNRREALRKACEPGLGVR